MIELKSVLSAFLFLNVLLVPAGSDLSLIDSAIEFSREIDPAMDPEKVRLQIRGWADEIRPKLSKALTPEEIVELLREFIYVKWHFRAEPVDGIRPEMGYYDTLMRLTRQSPKKIYENSFLVPVIANREGNCLGLTSVYLALAEELKLPIYPVIVPYHIFPRYDDGRVKINIEATAQGRNLPDDFYRKACRLSKDVIKKGAYLATLSRKDFISSYYLALGSIYSGRGLYKKAKEAYQHSLKLSPDLALAYSNLASIYSYYGVSAGWAEASRSSLKIDSDFLGGYLSLSNALAREGKYPDAISVMKDLVKKYPDMAFAHASLGELYLVEGRFREAIRSLEKAINIADWEPDFYVSLAKVYYYQKDYSRAWKYARQAKRLGLKDPTIFFMLARKSRDPQRDSVEEVKRAHNQP